ncbi:MAG TPA: hypothetical protein DCR24_00720 [Bacillus bacterium]|nr:hypothetical protein [Bacillus sp. (in: firmicutes)]
MVFISMFLLIIAEHYIAEKRFAKETEAIRLQEYYFMSSVKKAESFLKMDSLPTARTIDYQYGVVTFQKQALSANIEQITFLLKLKSGEEAIGIGKYDKVKGKMVNWVERN